ncbi:MAG: leucine-rich repeat domain-containing protein [Lachnospiraceae bacterium]|nr:leucine-rich repeat domain-containing protein [Lachnospiraceae bacterium]
MKKIAKAIFTLLWIALLFNVAPVSAMEAEPLSDNETEVGQTAGPEGNVSLDSGWQTALEEIAPLDSGWQTEPEGGVSLDSEKETGPEVTAPLDSSRQAEPEGNVSLDSCRQTAPATVPEPSASNAEDGSDIEESALEGISDIAAARPDAIEPLGESGQKEYRPDGATYHLLYHELEDGTLCIDGVKDNAEGKLILPSEIGKKKVSRIGMMAFINSTGITGSLIIPDSVEEIGEMAFSNCQGLTGNLVIGDSVMTIGKQAFSNCAFEGSLTIGKSFVYMDALSKLGAEGIGLNVSNFRIIDNRSVTPINLPITNGERWINRETGEEISEDPIAIANGTAYRSDAYDTWEKPVFTHAYVEPQTYTGGQIRPKLHVYFGKTELREKTDYTVKFVNNVNAGTAKFTITGKGNYSGKESDTFAIIPRELTEAEVSEIAPATEGKNSYKPVPAVTFNKKKLSKGKDFTVTYYSYALDDASDAVETAAPKAAGKYYAEIEGIKNFTNSVKRYFVIAEKAQTLVSRLTIEKIKPKPYTGVPVVLNADELIIKDGGNKLTAGEHYTVTYENNTDPGTAYAVITGVPESGYAGMRRISFKITGTQIKSLKLENFTASFIYDGTEKEQPAGDGGMTITKPDAGGTAISWVTEEDYKAKSDDEKKSYGVVVSYKNNVNAGTASMTFTGVNGIEGTLTKTFKIEPFNLNTADTVLNIKLDRTLFFYSKSGVAPKPEVSFKIGDSYVPLTAGKDYTLSYSDNKAVNVGTGKYAVVKVKGKGNFTGTNSNTTFMIARADMTAAGVKITANDVVYKDKKGNWKTGKLIVKDADGTVLKAGKDYDRKVRYIAGSTELGKNSKVNACTTIRVAIAGIGNYSGAATGTYYIAKQNISKLSASVAKKVYAGGPVTIEPGDIKWKKNGVEFTIDETSYRNNAKAGTASVDVVGTGNYCGRKTLKFKIASKGFRWWWE